MVSGFTIALAQDVPHEGNEARMIMKNREVIRHVELTVKGEKRLIPFIDPLKSAKETILQRESQFGLDEKKPPRFNSFDLLSAKNLKALDSTFVNVDYNTNSTPYVNAKHFENYGEFDVESPLQMPFYFYNTQSFTNKGKIYITGNIDFQTYYTKENLFGDFDYDPVMATNFVNERTGVVESKAEIGDFNFIRIHADEIINRGLISGAGSITIDLKGNDVDITGGALEMKVGASYDYYDDETGGLGRSFGTGRYNNQRRYTVFGDVTGGYHIPTWGVSDIYWCEYRNNVLAGLYGVGDLFGVGTWLHSWVELEGTYSIVGGPGLKQRPNGNYINWIGGWEAFNGRDDAVFDGFVDEVTFGYQDQIHYTGEIALVRNRHPDLFEVDARILPLSVDYNDQWEQEIFHSGKVVEIKTIKGLTNNISGGTKTESFYAIDELANVETSYNGMLTNTTSVAGTPALMPDSLVLTRFRPFEFNVASGFNSSYSDFLLWSEPSYGFFTTHGARISNIVSRAGISDLPSIDVPGSSKFNQPGSIFVVATNNLNLKNARLRGEGGIYLKAKHLVSAENVSLDCQNFSFDLGSTNGLLVVQKMFPDYVERFGGTIETMSAVWGGGTFDPGGDGGDSITLHNSVFAVDANLSLTNEVKIYDAVLRSTNVVVRDNMKIVDRFLVDSETFTVDGNLNFTVRDLDVSPYTTGQYFWDKTVAPRLTHFTNNGSILIGGTMKLGSDMDRGYEVVMNNGSIEAYEMWIKSDYIEHSGRVNTMESVYMDAKGIYFKGGNINATNSMYIVAENIKFNKHTNLVHHYLDINASKSMADAGADSKVLMEIYEGVRLKTIPEFGDLLGTRIRLVSTNYIRQANYWLAEDRGASTAGYRNNSSVGRLILKHSKARFPDDSSRILFKNDTAKKHAIYVDYLEFEDYDQLDYDNDGLYFLKIDENYTIYFAASNLDEEKLDGDLGGRLRWVKDYAGLNSSLPLFIKGLGRTVKVNRALRFSKVIDTDDDGTANGYDISPFGDGTPRILNVGLEHDDSLRISIKWLIIPNSRYAIQYKDDINQASWETLKEFRYSDGEIKYSEFSDLISRKSKARYYRIKYSD